MLEAHSGNVEGLAFSPDGRTLASASWDGSVKLWRVADGELVRTFHGHVGPVTGVAFLPDGRSLASTGDDGTVRVWSVETDRPRHTLTGLAGHGRSVR